MIKYNKNNFLSNREGRLIKKLTADGASRTRILAAVPSVSVYNMENVLFRLGIIEKNL